jgi:SAM-dependent methyltransferase
VDDYVRYRPHYPQQAIEWIRSQTRLTAASVVADIGSGTGISAEPFLRMGCTVFGVEPNRKMRNAAERLLGGFATFQSIEGSAEATTLADQSVDLIVSAQAFHWFDAAKARVEFSRILKSAGSTVLMWNAPRFDESPFLRAYEELLVKYATDYAKVRHSKVGDRELKQFFVNGTYVTHSVPHEQRFDFEGLKGRLLSSSFAPTAGQAGHDEMLNTLKAIFDRHQVHGQVCFEYETQVYLGR